MNSKNRSNYIVTATENIDGTVINYSASYQPDKNLSGFRYSFTYNTVTDVMTSNIGNGDVDDDTKKILLQIRPKKYVSFY
tara:strand:- start:292 stop:531 length:240 start_codon:yes stop_codon:yes gene_type:complete